MIVVLNFSNKFTPITCKYPKDLASIPHSAFNSTPLVHNLTPLHTNSTQMASSHEFERAKEYSQAVNNENDIGSCVKYV